VELRWSAGLPGVISGEHTFALSPVDGGTRLVQSESFRGLLVPFSGPAFARAEAGFRALNEALKSGSRPDEQQWRPARQQHDQVHS
jgi:hypothetical protein